jgi:preprotein translocase subunit SecA
MWHGQRRKILDHANDHVWASHSARLNGMAKAVASLTQAGRSVVVVALSSAALEELARLLASHQPTRCTDLFGQIALATTLSRPGSLVLALDSALPAVPTPAALPVDVIVLGRHDGRAADDAVVRFADGLGGSATVTFHLSLEDALLAAFTERVGPMLEKLGMTADEPIAHSLVTRAVERAQNERRASGG